MKEAYITIYQDKPPRKLLKPKAVFIGLSAVIALFIIIIIALSITLSSHLPDAVKVSNFADLQESLPSDIKNRLNAQLYYLLSLHFDVPERSNSVNAVLRSDTYQKTLDGDVENASFLVDIDAYKQSYLVHLSWSNTAKIPNDVLIECAPRDLSKYPDETCYGMYYDSASPYIYLPYEGTLPSGEPFTAEFGYQIDSEVHIDIFIEDCGDPQNKDVAVQTVKDYLSSNGLDAGQYIYEAISNYNDCLIIKE